MHNNLCKVKILLAVFLVCFFFSSLFYVTMETETFSFVEMKPRLIWCISSNVVKKTRFLILGFVTPLILLHLLSWLSA